MFGYVKLVYDCRLAGVAMIAPVINYWWPGFPAKLATEAYYEQFPQDQWALRVAHYAPSLVYWWNTQKWFPPSSVAAGRPNFTAPDLQVLAKLSASMVNRVLVFISFLEWHETEETAFTSNSFLSCLSTGLFNATGAVRVTSP